MKIGIDCGHTKTGSDYGSRGVLRDESYLTREVGVRVANKLKALGHTVINCYKDNCSSLGDSLSYRVTQANNNNVDLFISIHFNAFNSQAHGTEVWTYGGKHFTEADRVLNNLVALGYKNRGIKNGSDLYVLRNTKSKAMLIECCFCDNKADMDIYNAEKISDAIVKGITSKLPEKLKPKDNLYKVQVGAFKDKNNAENLKESLKRKGYEGFITE
ncbi:N-acetylmuramoyl-L-alanine amidase [Clostridium tetani]|uniref:N-acetylmuramoyl-L-alanine amidase n=1 Tax=Clostridium tetani TaxID=1513 RepID=UPI00102518B4|nr:N-acetylmuramoyl-L-alanine amidase [Clostridium tetani]RXI70487.1 N-acetylmuramoyl-L-alanine amidase [Clostridium tetani]